MPARAVLHLVRLSGLVFGVQTCTKFKPQKIQTGLPEQSLPTRAVLDMVRGLGFRVSGWGFAVWRLGVGGWGLGLEVKGWRIRVQNVGVEG